MRVVFGVLCLLSMLVTVACEPVEEAGSPIEVTASDPGTANADPITFAQPDSATADSGDKPQYDSLTAPIIVGSVDWSDTTELDSDGAVYDSSRAVGLLQIPAAGSRCTAFLVAPDVIMTNNHCIGSAYEARGASVSFNYERGTSMWGLRTYACEELIGTDVNLDFSLVRCEPKNGELPGERYGFAQLQAASPSTGDQVYVIHQNCDYYSDPNCDYTKKYSPGSVSGAWGDVFYHVADALGGSSGSPVFDPDTNAVIGLHHAGWGDQSTGRGYRNEAVDMAPILDMIADRWPEVLGQPGGIDDEPIEGELRSEAVDYATPHPYGNNADMERTFTAPGALKIRLHFSRLETEARYDFVYVAAGNQDEIFDGAMGELTTRWFDGEEVTLLFESDGSVTDWGFQVDRVEWIAAAEPEPEPEPEPDPEPGQLFVDFGSAHPYANHTDLIETFTVPSAGSVRVHFTDFDTESGYDFVTVTVDGESQTLDGDLGELTTDWLDGNSVTIQFDSDYSVTRWGFHVDYIEWKP